MINKWRETFDKAKDWNEFLIIKTSDVPGGMDKDQTFVGLSSEDEELLNQKLPGVSATSRTEQEAEKKVVYLVK